MEQKFGVRRNLGVSAFVIAIPLILLIMGILSFTGTLGGKVKATVMGNEVPPPTFGPFSPEQTFGLLFSLISLAFLFLALVFFAKIGSYYSVSENGVTLSTALSKAPMRFEQIAGVKRLSSQEAQELVSKVYYGQAASVMSLDMAALMAAQKQFDELVKYCTAFYMEGRRARPVIADGQDFVLLSEAGQAGEIRNHLLSPKDPRAFLAELGKYTNLEK